VTAGVLFTGAAEARDQIRVVGSSTVYPFTTTVAEQLGKTGGVKTPVVESTGTGGGMKLFCAGVGVEHPDATNASRRMKKSELEMCQKNGVKDIVELKSLRQLTVAQSKAGRRSMTSPSCCWRSPEVPGRRQADPQPEQDLVGHRQVAAKHQDRGARPAADLRHARQLP
jgi:hypothetical protein